MRGGCAVRLVQITAFHVFTFLHFYIAKYQLKYCKIVAKIVCSKMPFPGPGRLFSESGVRCTSKPTRPPTFSLSAGPSAAQPTQSQSVRREAARRRKWLRGGASTAVARPVPSSRASGPPLTRHRNGLPSQYEGSNLLRH